MTLLAKRSIGMLAAILLVVGAIAFWKYYTIRTLIAKMSAQKPPPTVVSSIKAVEEVWQERRHAVGSLAAVQGVTVGAEMAGKVDKIQEPPYDLNQWGSFVETTVRRYRGRGAS